MISVQEAEGIVFRELRDYGTEFTVLPTASNRVVSKPLVADRDLPPFNRVTMDGIAISFESYKKGIRSFRIKGTQAAGMEPIELEAPDECVEIMTGAALPN